MAYTIKALIDLAHGGEDFYYYCLFFLNNFYLETENEWRQHFIQAEPEIYENLDCFFYCDVAAIVHKLANYYKLNVPEWVQDKKYIEENSDYELNKNTKSEILRNYLEIASVYGIKKENDEYQFWRPELLKDILTTLGISQGY